MSKRLDQIIVIDIEATCWEDVPPSGQENEIIEVGICLLDVQSGERSNKKSYLIIPEFSTVSSFCTDLTGLTQKKVNKGIRFNEVCKALQHEFLSKRRVWASYGNFDYRLFCEQCTKRKIAYPFSTSHINIKTLFALRMQLHREVGMAKALKNLDITFEGTPHSGADDAWNAALILSKLLFAKNKPKDTINEI